MMDLERDTKETRLILKRSEFPWWPRKRKMGILKAKIRIVVRIITKTMGPLRHHEGNFRIKPGLFFRLDITTSTQRFMMN